MRSWLILVVAFTVSEAASNCVKETNWVQCNCIDDLENTIFILQHTRSENGNWTNEITSSDHECNMSSTIQSFRDLYEGSQSTEAIMIGKGYERHGESLYKLHTISRTWENARRTCEKEGAHLAIINSDEEAGALSELYRKYPTLHNVQHNNYIFIGFHDIYNEGEYLTILGEPITKTGYNRWESPDPNNYFGNNNGNPGEDCGCMYRSGKLADIGCDYLGAFICELEDKPVPLPGNIDYSAGKYTGVEKVVKPPPGTVPRTDPGEGYEFFPGVGFYRLHTITDVWENARRMCEKEGAHLAVVNSELEAQVLIQMFKQRPEIVDTVTKDFAFIGFHDQFNEGDYITIYGEPLTSTGYYRWWNANNPDNKGPSYYISSQDCGAFYRHGGFDDVSCNLKHAFFCEKELLQ